MSVGGRDVPRIKFGTLLMLMSCTLFSACPSFSPRPVDFRDCVSLSEAGEKEILGQLSHQAAEVRTLRALYKGRLREGINEKAFSQVVAFQRPDKLRLEILATSLNRLTALIVVNDGKLFALDPLKRIVYQGFADRQTMQRMLTVPFKPDELMLWFTGQFKPPDSRFIQSQRLFWCEDKAKIGVELAMLEGRTLLLTLSSEGWADVLAKGVEADTDVSAKRNSKTETSVLRLESLSVRDTKKQDIFVSKFSYENVAPEEMIVASKISFWLPQMEIAGSFALRKGKLNTPLDSRGKPLFSQKVPPGTKIVPLERNSKQQVAPMLMQ